MAREKTPDFARKGNWKNAPGSKPAASTKSAPPKPKAKPAAPAKAARSTPPKPKAKPESVKAKGYTRGADMAGGPRKGPKDMAKLQTRIGAARMDSGPAFVKGGGSTTISKTPAKSAKSGASRSTAGKKSKDNNDAFKPMQRAAADVTNTSAMKAKMEAEQNSKRAKAAREKLAAKKAKARATVDAFNKK